MSGRIKMLVLGLSLVMTDARARHLLSSVRRVPKDVYRLDLGHIRHGRLRSVIQIDDRLALGGSLITLTSAPTRGWTIGSAFTLHEKETTCVVEPGLVNVYM